MQYIIQTLVQLTFALNFVSVENTNLWQSYIQHKTKSAQRFHISHFLKELA